MPCFAKHSAHVSSPSCSSVPPFIPLLLSLSPPFVLISRCQPVQFPLCGFPSHCIWFYLAVLGRPVLLLKGLAPSWNIHPSGAWLLDVNAQSVSAHCWWHFAVALALGKQICHKGRALSVPKPWGFCTAGHQQSDLEKKESRTGCEVCCTYLSKPWNYGENFEIEQERGGGRCWDGKTASLWVESVPQEAG